MFNAEEYRNVLIEINEKWGTKAERFILLTIGFVCSWSIFIPLIVIHTKIAGLKKEDSDLISFYLPLFSLSAVINLASYPLMETNFFMSALYLNIALDYFIKIFILFDGYKALSGEASPTIKIISFSEKSLTRKSVKGYTIPEVST